MIEIKIKIQYHIILNVVKNCSNRCWQHRVLFHLPIKLNQRKEVKVQVVFIISTLVDIYFHYSETIVHFIESYRVGDYSKNQE